MQSDTNISRHTERKRKYPVTNTKELPCKQDNYIEITNQLDCFGSKEPHNDDNSRYSRHSECNEESHSCCNLRGYFAHAQYDVKEHNVGYKREKRGDVGKLKCKVAFTLAEILITLGIIGVVAALTLPMVIANYNKKVYSTRLKSFYTSMSQAILTSESVNGPKEYWGVEANNDEKMLDVFNTYITPYLNLISKPTKRKRSFTMTNGVVISLYSGSCTDLYTDLNGDKKPNKVGVDIYYFTICTFYKPPLEPYLYNTGLYSRSQLLDKCKTNPAFCSSLLFYDEWGYKNDYPYKLR